MAVLFAAQQVAGAAQFQIQSSNLKAGAQVAEFLQCRQSFAGNFGELRIYRHKQISVRSPVGTAHPAAQLIELTQAVFLSVFHDHGVG